MHTCTSDYGKEQERLYEELAALLCKHGRESVSGTPNFVLAEYLMACLRAYETAVKSRERFGGSRVAL